MNPWKESLGCEVSLCQAKQCDSQRLDVCALRKYYLERLAWLNGLLCGIRNPKNRQEIELMIKNLTGDNIEEGSDDQDIS